jgi:hypothetical protein
MTKHTRGKFTVYVVKTQDTEDGIYIGRPMPGRKGSVLENPYRVKDGQSNGSVIPAFKDHLKKVYVKKDSAVKAECQRLADILETEGEVTLRCWCAPKTCHGDVIAMVLFRILEKRGHDVPKDDESPIDLFKGKYAFLSNMYKTRVTIRDHEYNCTETFYQAMKGADPSDVTTVQAAGNGYEAKALGKKVTARADWSETKVGFMREALAAKFESPSLRKKLLATGERSLIESNHWHDNFWGTCTCDNHVYTTGNNVLGYLLMELRKKLRKV